MKSERFVHSGVWIETNRDMNGRYFIAWKPNSSRIARDASDLLRWLQCPPKTPTGEAIREWLKQLKEQDDANRKTPRPVVGDANVEGSFDPLAHDSPLDDSDPNHNTRTVI